MHGYPSSFHTWGKESSFLFTSNCIFIPLNKSFPMWQILPHMGKDFSFLPLDISYWLSLTAWGRSQAFFPLKCKAILPHRSHAWFLEVHPSPASPQNATLPFPSNPPPSICKEWFFPLQIAKPPQILPYNYKFILYLYFSSYFYLSIFIFLFLKNFLWIFFSFFPQKLGILPQHLWKNYSPAFEANNRRIDPPAHLWWLGRQNEVNANRRISPLQKEMQIKQYSQIWAKPESWSLLSKVSLSVFFQYIDKLIMKNYGKMNINFCKYFTNTLWINKFHRHLFLAQISVLDTIFLKPRQKIHIRQRNIKNK